MANLDRGVVFIDEAYALTQWSDGKPEGYGSEAVSAMVEFMTRYKGLYCLLAAGYEREMTRYFLPTNPGLPRRFPYRFVLHDLTPDELRQAMDGMAAEPLDDAEFDVMLRECMRDAEIEDGEPIKIEKAVRFFLTE